MKNIKHSNEKVWFGAGIVTAIAASICCVTPVVAFLAGISGVASTFSWLEPFRHWMVGLTLLFLGIAWYQKLKPQWDPSCACEANPSFWKSKTLLGILTVLTGVLMAFPYYSEAFIPTQDKHIVYVEDVEESQAQTVDLTIDGMTCTGCEAAVEQAAGGVPGVLQTDASYATGKAMVKYDRTKTDQKTITNAINRTGFTVADSEVVQ